MIMAGSSLASGAASPGPCFDDDGPVIHRDGPTRTLDVRNLVVWSYSYNYRHSKD